MIAATSLGQHELRFVASMRPTIQGFAGAGVILAGAGAWAWWTGRASIEYLAACALFAAVALPIAAVRRRGNLEAHAASLGKLELDDRGIRWRLPDATLAFTTEWTEIERCLVDGPTLYLILRDSRAFPLAPLENGVPSAQYVLDRRDELVKLVEKRVPTAPHVAAPSVEAGTRAILLGVGVCVASSALYGTNLVAGSLLHWERALVLMPAVMAGIGAIVVGAGLQVRFGRAPLVSPLYGAGHTASITRFVVVAWLMNFVLLAVLNVLAR